MNPKASCLLTASILLVACNGDGVDEAGSGAPGEPVRISEHRQGDDLLSAGLGLQRLAGPAPEPADAAAPTAAELRRMAIHKAWNGIYTLTPAGGVGGLLNELPEVPGREFHAFVRLEGADHPVRMMLQLPDRFDGEDPCLVAAPASGSRGVYGALPLAAPWALPAGCAVVYTDKGAGTDFFDFSTGTGVTLDGTRGRPGEAALGFEPDVDPQADLAGHVALPHVHSGDHPEADWGRHVLRSIEFALRVLSEHADGDYGPANTRIIAAGLSNGGGAVLRAAEQDADGLLDAVVAVAPNVTPPQTPPLYDYATAAALYQPCLLADLDGISELPLGNPMLAALGEVRCSSLLAEGLIEESDAASARRALIEFGFDEAALSQSAVNVSLDLWRTVAASYASAYLLRGPSEMPCGYAYTAEEATPAQRHAWWPTHSGVGGGQGIALADALAEGRDKPLPGLLCLRQLWTGDGEDAQALREAVGQIRASAAPRSDIPILVIHGRQDGLVPAAFSSRPYVKRAQAAGARIAYWEIDGAQHFDVLLAAPSVAGRYVPLLPYGWAALDRLRAVLDGDAEVGGNRLIEPTPPPAGEPLRRMDLGL